MVNRKDVLDLSFYKMSPFKGSDRKLRYKIEREEKDEKELLTVTIWPGPYNFEKTDDSLKESHSEEFSEDGMQKIIDYINKKSEEYNA